jgi:hypothetical protein
LSWIQNPANVSASGGDIIIKFDIKDANGNLLGSVMAHAGTSNYEFPIQI